MNKIKIYRNEWKYCCSADEIKIIRNRLSAVMQIDSNSGGNGNYEIHSLYFDDYKDTCAKENEAGISERFKYRIRYYDSCPSSLNLECKEKIDGRCYKKNAPISLQEYQKIMDGDLDEVMWQTDNPLLQRFCVRCMIRRFVPKVIIDYERTAYVEENTHIRITLDENISAAGDVCHFLEGDYTRYPLQEKHQHVLEVKFDYILPEYLKKLITNRRLVQSAFSKYCVGRKKLQSMGVEI